MSVDELPTIRILGTRVHIVENPQVVQAMERWIQTDPDVCHYVVNTGMHGLISGHRDPKFKHILNSASLFAPDGILVMAIARLRGFSIRRSNTGPDLMWDFSKIANQNKLKYFMYGDTNDTLQALAEKLHDTFPDIQIVGKYSPPFRNLTEQEDLEILAKINQAKPDVLWVGLGAPKQERWMFDHRKSLNVPVVVGVGAAFKYHSGIVSRAPGLFRKLGVEWFWRLGQEPGRVWRRVFVDAPQFLLLAVSELLGLRQFD